MPDVNSSATQLRAGQVYGGAALNRGHFAGRSFRDSSKAIAGTYTQNVERIAPEAPLDTAALRQSPANYFLDKSETGLFAAMFSPTTGDFSLDHGVADNDAARIRWQIRDQSDQVIGKLWEHRESINAILGMSGYGDDGARNVALTATVEDGVITLRDVYRDREPITLRVAPPRRAVESRLAAVA